MAEETNQSDSLSRVEHNSKLMLNGVTIQWLNWHSLFLTLVSLHRKIHYNSMTSIYTSIECITSNAAPNWSHSAPIFRKKKTPNSINIVRSIEMKMNKKKCCLTYKYMGLNQISNDSFYIFLQIPQLRISRFIDVFSIWQKKNTFFHPDNIAIWKMINFSNVL